MIILLTPMKYPIGISLNFIFLFPFFFCLFCDIKIYSNTSTIDIIVVYINISIFENINIIFNSIKIEII